MQSLFSHAYEVGKAACLERGRKSMIAVLTTPEMKRAADADDEKEVGRLFCSAAADSVDTLAKISNKPSFAIRPKP